jgi:tRNA(Ile)-lysidine synthase
MVYQQVVKQEEEAIYFDLNQLRKLPNYSSYLYQWLRDFGFSAWDDIYNLVESQSGKQVLSAEFRLLKDRDSLILTPIKLDNDQEEYFIEVGTPEVNVPLNLSFEKVDAMFLPTIRTIFVDHEKLEFPLVLRRWNDGDNFQPFGMEGKSKKVSKLFKDEKLSLLEKENIWVLWSGAKIVWIVGLRQDERFRVNNSTSNILKIELQ